MVNIYRDWAPANHARPNPRRAARRPRVVPDAPSDLDVAPQPV